MSRIINIDYIRRQLNPLTCILCVNSRNTSKLRTELMHKFNKSNWCAFWMWQKSQCTERYVFMHCGILEPTNVFRNFVMKNLNTTHPISAFNWWVSFWKSHPWEILKVPQVSHHQKRSYHLYIFCTETWISLPISGLSYQQNHPKVIKVIVSISCASPHLAQSFVLESL